MTMNMMNKGEKRYMGKKALLIAEKSSLMNSLKSAYTKHKKEFDFDIDFLHQRGHLLELKGPDEINPEYKKWRDIEYPLKIEFKYKVKKDTKNLYDAIKTALKSGKYDFVINAGDPDQEGEILIRETLYSLNNNLPVLRFWNNAQTEEEYLKGLKNLRPDSEYDRYYEAALIRQHMDYKYGMNMTRLLTVKSGPLIRIGRVKGAIVRMLVDREREIRNFVPHSDYKHAFKYEGLEFVGTEVFKTKDEASHFADSVDVTEIKEENKKVKPPKFYKLSTAQTDAYKMFHMSAKDTLAAIQGLYEKGYVSYPRTDCEYISENVNVVKIIESVGNLIDIPNNSLRNPNEVKKDKSYFNNKAIAEEGHTALIPTGTVPYGLTGNEKDIYFMILRRFIAVFGELKTIRTLSGKAVDSDKEEYSASVTWDVDAGFERILNPNYKLREKPALGNPVKGYIASPDWCVHEIKAKCPPRYTNGSLNAAMERPGKVEGVSYLIGTPATRANIIEDCKKAGYYTEKGGQYYATEFAEAVITNFGHLPIFSVENTGKWEYDLDNIRKGNGDAKDVESRMESSLNEQVASVTKQTVSGMASVGQGGYPPKKATGAFAKDTAKGIGTCPLCGNPITENQKAFGCTNWKNGCKYTIWKNFMGTKISAADAKKLINGDAIKKKVTSKAGKTWEQALKFNPKECKMEFV